MTPKEMIVRRRVRLFNDLILAGATSKEAIAMIDEDHPLPTDEPILLLSTSLVSLPDAPWLRASIGECQDCRTEVWLRPEAVDLLTEHPETEVVCVACGMARLRGADEVFVQSEIHGPWRHFGKSD